MLFEGELETTRKRSNKRKFIKIKIETGNSSYTIEIQKWKVLVIILAVLTQIMFFSFLASSKRAVSDGRFEDYHILSMKVAALKNRVAELKGMSSSSLSFVEVPGEKDTIYMVNYKDGEKSVSDSITAELSELEKGLKDLREKILLRNAINDYLPTLRPTDGVIKSKFGTRFHPIFEEYKFHTGIDISAEVGTPVLASGAGQVVEVGNSYYGLGRYIKIKHINNLQTVYAHLNQVFVRKGEFVEKGQIIGTVGNSGLATGPNLHFEILYKGKPIDPEIFLVAD